MKKILFLICVILSVSTNGYAQETFEEKIAWDRLNLNIYQFEDISQSKLSLIIDLIEQSQTVTNLQKSFRQMHASLDDARKKEMEEALNLYEIVEQIIPIYDKHYTEAELKEVVAFYKSSAGQKMLKSGPQIAREAIAVTAKYFQSKLTPPATP